VRNLSPALSEGVFEKRLLETSRISFLSGAGKAEKSHFFLDFGHFLKSGDHFWRAAMLCLSHFAEEASPPRFSLSFALFIFLLFLRVYGYFSVF